VETLLEPPEPLSVFPSRELVLVQGYPWPAGWAFPVHRVLSRGFRKTSLRELDDYASCLELCEQALSHGIRVRMVRPEDGEASRVAAAHTESSHVLRYLSIMSQQGNE